MLMLRQLGTGFMIVFNLIEIFNVQVVMNVFILTCLEAVIVLYLTVLFILCSR